MGGVPLGIELPPPPSPFVNHQIQVDVMHLKAWLLLV